MSEGTWQRDRDQLRKLVGPYLGTRPIASIEAPGNQHTAHGFRSMASTLLNEQGWHPDLIELQLAHAERNKVRAAYNKA